MTQHPHAPRPVSPSLDGAPVSLAALLAAYRGRPLAVREAAPRSKSRTNLVDSAPWPTIDISPSSTMRSPAWTCTWPPRSSRPLPVAAPSRGLCISHRVARRSGPRPERVSSAAPRTGHGPTSSTTGYLPVGVAGTIRRPAGWHGTAGSRRRGVPTRSPTDALGQWRDRILREAQPRPGMARMSIFGAARLFVVGRSAQQSGLGAGSGLSLRGPSGGASGDAFVANQPAWATWADSGRRPLPGSASDAAGIEAVRPR